MKILLSELDEIDKFLQNTDYKEYLANRMNKVLAVSPKVRYYKLDLPVC